MATTLQAVPTAQIETVWKETFTSESINQRFQGLGRGVRHGFVPAIGAANDELELDVDVRATDSVAEVGGTGGQAGITIQVREPAQVSLDLTGLAAADYYIGIRPGYTTGLTTTADYVAYTLSEVQGGTPTSEGSVLLCRVTTTGNVGQLSDISLADDDFIRDDMLLVKAATDGGDLQLVKAVDFGAGGSQISVFDLALSRGVVAGSTGVGALTCTPSGAAEQVLYLFGDLVPVQAGQAVCVTVRYQGNTAIDPALSQITLVEVDEAGEAVATQTSTLADTAGAWVTARRQFVPTNALSRYIIVSFTLVSTGATPFYLDSAALYVQRVNDASEDDRRLMDAGSPDLSAYTVRIVSPDPVHSSIELTRLGQRVTLSAPVGDNIYLTNSSNGAVTATAAATYPGRIFTLRSGDANFAEKTSLEGANASLFAQTGTGDYFDFDDGTNIYRVWFNVFDAPNPPGPPTAPAVTTEVLVEVPIRAGWRSAQVNEATVAAINDSAANAEAELTHFRLFNSQLRLESIGMRLDDDAPIIFEDGFRVANTRLTNSLDATGAVISNSLSVRSGDDQAIGIFGAKNTPVAWGRMTFNSTSGDWEIDYQTGLEATYGSSGAGVDNEATATPRVQLDTTIPIANDEVTVVTNTARSGFRTYVEPLITYTTSTDVTVAFSVYNHATDAAVVLGAGLNNNDIFFVIFAERE